MMQSERVLIWLKPQFLGDAVMATPLLDALSEAYVMPHVSAGRGVCTLLADRRDRLVFVEAGNLKKVSRFLQCVAAMRRERYEAVYLVNRSFRCALAAKLAGIKTRVGHATEGRKFLLTTTAAYDAEKAESECYLDLARAAGLEPRSVHPKLTVTEEELQAGSLFGPGRWVGVQPGARSAWKQLPQEALASVSSALRDAGFGIALFGGVEEMGDAQAFEEAIGGSVLNLVGKLELRKTMGALTHLDLMLGNDTGLMHIAAALGCPTLTVFGVICAAKWGHIYEPHVAIQAPGGDLKRVNPADLVSTALKMSAGTRTAPAP
jgi:heptosyltransferase-2